MIEIKVKPLSVNECWQGKRFKTPKYKQYERRLMAILPEIEMPEPPFIVDFEFSFSTHNADIDNAVKPLTDIMQKRYKFNDRDILIMRLTKKKVQKGNEGFKFKISKHGL